MAEQPLTISTCNGWKTSDGMWHDAESDATEHRLKHYVGQVICAEISEAGIIKDAVQLHARELVAVLADYCRTHPENETADEGPT